MSIYENKPQSLLDKVSIAESKNPKNAVFCAGFELNSWRCDQLSDHLIEWIADYALQEDDLDVNHGNMYVRLKEAAVRVYKSDKYKSRGEVGEILLHLICRDFFDTFPIAPRVFYLTSSNDVVKSFDLVHARYNSEMEAPELWLGEAKFFKNGTDAISAAIESVTTHIDQGFINREKLLLGPQISKSTPHFNEIRELLSTKTSIDKLFANAVFPICIASDSKSIIDKDPDQSVYTDSIIKECEALSKKVEQSSLVNSIKIILIYLPIESKDALSAAFDKRLKGLQG